jgi:hypothetical protein
MVSSSRVPDCAGQGLPPVCFGRHLRRRRRSGQVVAEDGGVGQSTRDGTVGRAGLPGARWRTLETSGTGGRSVERFTHVVVGSAAAVPDSLFVALDPPGRTSVANC